MRFATVQSKAAIMEIVRNFEITLGSNTKSPYVLSPVHFISEPVGGLWINLKKITK